ncbi:MAG: MCP four helix bundle domain-containing protein [Ignavibacteriales bacterium]|nr:MCP four helix bundle domain-containing protein [Ignavibacteriales bacterium]
MKIKIKLILGFVVLAIMLSISGFWSIYEFNTISDSVSGILKENYKSIEAAHTMTKAIKIQEDGIVLIYLNQDKKGKEILDYSDSLFIANYNIARNNITIDNEEKYLDTINTLYLQFKTYYQDILIKISSNNLSSQSFIFLQELTTLILDEIDKLININDKMMKESVSNLQKKAYRAITPGVIAIIAAFIFILLFSYLINHYLVKPIINITQSIDKFKDKGTSFDVKIESNDEIKDLAHSVHDLCEYLKYRNDK